MTGNERMCDLCEDAPSAHWEEVENEETGELADANLCKDCRRNLRDYNQGVEVDWGV